jgi:hypothetical protein
VEDLLCRALAAGVLPRDLAPSDVDAMWELATRRSVDEMFAALLDRTADGVVPELRARAQARLRTATARELLRERDLRDITAALRDAAVRALLVKGAGLAYTHYDDPRLRPGDDVDLLIAAADIDAADTALAAIGFRRQVEPDATLASFQRHYVRGGDGDIERCLDLHWRVSNRHVFADAVQFEPAWAGSIPVEALGPAARTLGLVDALVLACAHRTGHHPGHGDLLWLWDIHLLAGALTADAWEELADRATVARMAAVVAHGLRSAHERFGTPIEPRLFDRLNAVSGEPSARFIGGAGTQVTLLRSDLSAAGSLSRRLRLLGEHLFPSADYMRKRYPGWPVALLPLAYVHRVLRGAPGWFRRD